MSGTGAPVLDGFFKGGVFDFSLTSPSMYGISANQSSFLLRVKRKTTPGPTFRMNDQFFLYGIRVHVVKFLDELGLTPDVEIVEAGLPK